MTRIFRLASENELLALQRRMGGSSAPQMPDARPYERDVQAACLQALWMHPKVSLAWRANSGGFHNAAGAFVKMNFVGCADIIGMLAGGRFLAVECKRIDEEATTAQQAFLDNVNAGGSLAFVAHSVDDVFRNLPA